MKAQIRKDIESIPQLGVANDQNLRAYLRARGITQKRLLEVTEKQILNETLNKTFSDISIMSDLEAKKAFESDNTKFSFSYLGFLNEAFLAKVDTSRPEVITEYFNNNKENYRKPKSVKYSYVELLPEDYKSQVELSEDDLQASYQAQIDDFKLPKKMRLRQIVISKTDKPTSALEKLVTPEEENSQEKIQEKAKKTEEEKKELSLKTKARLNDGEDFAKVASEVSEDLLTKDKGGDLGWLEAKNIPETIRAKAIELEAGEISTIINTKDSFYIVKADEVEAEKYKPYEEVRAKLENDLRLAAAPTYAKVDAYNLIDGLRESEGKEEAANFVDFFNAKGKKVVVNQDYYPQGQGKNPEEVKITAGAIVSLEGSIDVLDIGSKVFIYHVDSVKDSYLPDLSEVIADVTDDFKQAESKKLAQNNAQTALEKIIASTKSGKSLQDALAATAAEDGLELKESEAFSRQGNRSDPFNSLQGGENIFNLTKDSPLAEKVFEGQDGYYLIALKEIVPAPAEEFAAKKKELEEEEQGKAQNRLYQALIANLKAHSKIWIDPSVMEKNR